MRCIFCGSENIRDRFEGIECSPTNTFWCKSCGFKWDAATNMGMMVYWYNWTSDRINGKGPIRGIFVPAGTMFVVGNL